MLALTLRDKDYLFVYHRGTAIGAIFFGKERSTGRAKFPVQFNGPKDEFEVLRPKAVEARYGRHELERLIREFCPDKAQDSQDQRRSEPISAAVAENPAEYSPSRLPMTRRHRMPIPISRETERAAS